MNEIICPSCYRLNRQGARFCAACGRVLAVSSTNDGDEAPTRPSAPTPSDGARSDDAHTIPMARSLDLHVGRRTDVGRRREINEDSLLALDLFWTNRSSGRPAGLFVVADGMGGHKGGEIASGMLVRSLARQAVDEWLPGMIEAPDEPAVWSDWLVAAIQRGNTEIFEWSRQAGFEMGTTVVAAVVVGDQAYIAHVGDSRAYRVNAGGIVRLTVDHSLVESLVSARQISPEEARHHPQSNVIYRTIGDHPQVVVDLKSLRLLPGDRLLLCSDGLSGMLTDEMIRAEIMAAEAPQSACVGLVDAANEAGGEDNCSVILIELKPL
ncbi:MAG: Stp1/IreP family PP2C-type Ser/Thr phosphatase [Anaerolineae bacterium]|uniref:Stp1/IreP family PP2C-type Ser/Thr phosphatase n=1 Tax=Promineifilum sp. TaxID=2664178 RepID=UPI001E0187B3|nr:Stp1/IreP family PP2C-type Ser/Thr phosphatase [Anaerolineales bacterium]MCB8934031.1 Stp1/IreP family PP2C-type Ser/Thr phosphatase [Promineifilum sp.]MCO5179432.1 Stp1/IreP family PP2C-type Ser/Thr phosphatase [Promineifilum sp.]MCW5845853.1 Stp1/IreP family PP2C-type Ser/Thr phosphatase [Anaerolineae bacterium]